LAIAIAGKSWLSILTNTGFGNFFYKLIWSPWTINYKGPLRRVVK
jgi:hypothetical protein